MENEHSHHGHDKKKPSTSQHHHGEHEHDHEKMQRDEHMHHQQAEPIGSHDHKAMQMCDHAHHRQHEMPGGHDEHAEHHTEDFLNRFWLCLVITIPILLLSHMIHQWVGFTLTFPRDRYVLLVLSSFIYFYGRWPFLVGLVAEMKHHREHFETLSKDIYELVKTFGAGQQLYYTHCPMYNNNKGADWLSETKEISNPYLGKEMPTCGKVKEELK